MCVLLQLCIRSLTQMNLWLSARKIFKQQIKYLIRQEQKVNPKPNKDQSKYQICSDVMSPPPPKKKNLHNGFICITKSFFCCNCDFCVIKHFALLEYCLWYYKHYVVKYKVRLKRITISELAFSKLPHCKCMQKWDQPAWFIWDSDSSAPKHKVKYCFCAVLYSIWQISNRSR